MNTKNRIALTIIALIIAFLAGRFSVSKNTETTEDTKKQKEHEVVTIITEPSGKKTETIVRDRVTDETSKSSRSTVVKPKTNISAMYAVKHDGITPVYGLSVSKELIGPIAIGAYGMTNGDVGIAIGMNF